jgi:hypothetical protein
LARVLLCRGRGRGGLTGLVFIGVSINLDKIVSNPGYGSPGRALEALVLLMGVLMVTSSLLIQGRVRWWLEQRFWGWG